MFECRYVTGSGPLNSNRSIRWKLRRPILVISIVAIVSVSAIFGQEIAHSDTPVFKVNSELVLVPVVVTKNGQHVGSLKQDSFTVLEDGIKQRISLFEEVLPTVRGSAWATPTPGISTNSIWDNEVPSHATVFLFDLINTPFIKQEHVRNSLVTFFSALPDTQGPMMLAVLTPKGLKVLHGFTTKASVLRESVTKMRTTFGLKDYGADLRRSNTEAQMAADAAVAAKSQGHPDADAEEVQRLRQLFQGLPDAFVEAQNLNRTSLTLELLQQLAHALAGIPGRKSLVWVTGGLEYTSGSEPVTGLATGFHRGQIKTEGISPNMIAGGNEMFDLTWNELSNANVAVYPVDVEEIGNPAYSDAGSMSSTVPILLRQGFGTRAQAMNGFTDKTGGRYCELKSNLESCFRAAVDDSSSHYIIGYYPGSSGKSGWRRLMVDVHLGDVKTRARSGYFYRRDSSGPSSFQSEIALILASPMDATGIPLAIRWLPSPTPSIDTSRKRYFEIFIDPRAIIFDGAQQNHFHLRLAAATRSEQGKFAEKLAKNIDANLQPSQLLKLRQEGLAYRDVVEVSPKEREIRFVFRDEIGGSIGSITVQIEPH